MRALTYLLLTKFKNSLKQLVKNPAKLIYTIFMIAMFVLVIVAGQMGKTEAKPGETLSKELLLTFVFLLYTVIFYLTSISGFHTGANMFKLPDVNLIFVSPFSPRKALVFGLIQQLGMSVLTGFFLIFQYGWVSIRFGITIVDMVFIMLGYMMVVFLSQLLAMLIYTTTNHNEKLKKLVKVIYYLPLAVFIVYYGLQLVREGSISLDKLQEIGNGAGVKYFPITGWLADLVRGIMLGETSTLILGVILTIVGIGAILITLFRVKMDYYEDVLQTAEVSYTAIAAAREGRIQEAAPRNVKLGKVGLERGEGANTFYYKHLIENRRGKTQFISAGALVFIAISLIFSFFLREAGVIPALAFATYMQMFSCAMGRLPKELTKPYIYLVPESSLKKLIYSLKEALSGYIGEAVLFFVPLGFILQLPVPVVLIGIVLRITISFLFISGNLLTERIFGTLNMKMLIFFFYMVVLVILLLPGIVAGVILSTAGLILFSEIFTVFLAMAVCNVLVTMLVIYLCRNILQYAELKN